MLSRDDLHQYQRRGVDHIVEMKRSGLFLGLGLGKTATSLTAVVDLLDACAITKVLVIAPLRVANSVWPKEVTQWQHTRHLRVSVVTGSEKARIAALHRSADVYVINRENIVWLVGHYGKRWPFDCVVVDESSSFKNPSSKRFKALKRVASEIEYLWLLTATPAPNSLLELWPQMYLVDFGKRLGRTMGNYKQRFFESDFMGYKWTPRDGSPDKIHDLISDRVISMSSEDYLQLPERIDLTERVTLPAKVMRDYQEFERTLLAELDDGTEIEAATAAVLANKLLQWASGATYTDDKGNWYELHNAKIDALKEVHQQANEPMLVAYNYKSDLARLKAAFPDAVVLDKRQATIEKWNQGDIDMLLVHPASAGHGLNLQAGGAMLVWFSLCWSLELYEQLNGRLHRQGQTKPVRIVHIVSDGTIDDRVLAVLADKEATQQALLQSIKAK